jgi:hypothetical protein
MLNETGTPTAAAETETSNTDYDMENVLVFPVKSQRSTAFRIPASAITARFSPASPGAGGDAPPEAVTIQLTEKEMLENHRQNMIPDVCDVYMREIFFKLHTLGYNVLSEEFEKDLQFVYEALQSTLLRTYGIGHPVQDFVNEHFEVVEVDSDEVDTDGYVTVDPSEFSPDNDPKKTT